MVDTRQGNELNADFNGAEEGTAGPVLYHCVNRPVTDDSLRPTCLREVNGRKDTFLFAATHLSKALAFAFDYHNESPGIICNGAIDGTPDEFAIICNRDKTLNELPYIKVYAFPADGFEYADPGTESRQSVSTQAMPLAKAKVVLETSNVEDLMRHGLQIFSTDKTFDQLGGQKFFDSGNAVTNEDWLGQLLKTGNFHWENHERGLNPTPELLRALIPAVASKPASLNPGT